MKRINLNSQSIASVAYKEETQILHVWLRSGRHVVHRNVSEGVYQNLMTADPPDFYYDFYINDGHRGHHYGRSTAKFIGALVLGVLLFAVSASEIRNSGEAQVTAAVK